MVRGYLRSVLYLPIDKRPRARNYREPFAYLVHEFSGAPSAGQFRLKPSLGSGIASPALPSRSLAA